VGGAGGEEIGIKIHVRRGESVAGVWVQTGCHGVAKRPGWTRRSSSARMWKQLILLREIFGIIIGNARLPSGVTSIIQPK
jgi:hypothetical protein